MSHYPLLVSLDMPPESDVWRIRLYYGREKLADANLGREKGRKVYHGAMADTLERWKREVLQAPKGEKGQ